MIGVSYDSPGKNRKFAEKNGLPFLLLSDSDHELAKSVGAARTLLPFAKRVSYLVGPDGLVLVAYPDVDPMGVNFVELRDCFSLKSRVKSKGLSPPTPLTLDSLLLPCLGRQKKPEPARIPA